MKTKITVTKTDIKKGRLLRKSCPASKSCPVYQALVRKKINVEAVAISSVRFRKNGLYFSLPQKVSDFINRFDTKMKVKPFSFSMDIPKKFFKKSTAKK